MTKPLVSVIVPTKNSAATLEACLKSIKEQSYKNIETIVVDNFSTDETQKIAKKYADKFYEKGPERSAQRNYGVKKCDGQYVAIIDSDMELTEKVIDDCVNAFKEKPDTKGVIIPEESFGEGFWAQCKKLERSYYVGKDWIEAARFYPKKVYQQVGGYDEQLISGEDWDLSNRIREIGTVARTSSLIRHNEGRLSYFKSISKKYFYASEYMNYVNSKSAENPFKEEVANVFNRYILFISKPSKILMNPHIWLGMLILKTSEYSAGVLAQLSRTSK